MIIQHIAVRAVVEDSLSSRGVDVAVARKDNRTSTVSARDTALVRIWTSRATTSADRDVVDLIDWIRARVIRAANTSAQELVPIAVLLINEGSLHLVVVCGFVSDLVLVARPEDILAVDGYPRLVDVVPVGPPLDIPFVVARAVDDIGVDSVIGAATGRGDHDSLVAPRSRLHCSRCCVANGRRLAAGGTDRVEAVVDPPDVNNVGRPKLSRSRVSRRHSRMALRRWALT